MRVQFSLQNAIQGGFKAKAPQAFAVRGIPAVFVLDRQGKIVAQGHPAAMDLPEIVNGLLA